MSSLEMVLLLVVGILLVLVGMVLTTMCRPARKQRSKQESKLQKIDFSKRLIADIRVLLWVVTVGGLFLAFYCIRTGYTGSLPWISAMVGLPWTAHGTVCAFYLNMAKSDHRSGGITYDAAAAVNFNAPLEPEGSINSPAI